MHEAHMVEQLITRAIHAADGQRVKRVYVALGELSDVSPDALKFYFDTLRADTVMAAADLAIRIEPGRVRCADCENVFDARDEFAACPACGSLRHVILRGAGLAVEAFDVE